MDPSGKGFIGEGIGALCSTLCDPIDVIFGGMAALKARSLRKKHFPDPTKQGGRGDAFRHCAWNCIMRTSIWKEGCVYQIGNQHEEDNIANGGPTIHVPMDLHNNGVGIGIGQGCWTDSCCY
jgi:hypothetical protein